MSGVRIPDGSPNKETDLLVGFFIYIRLGDSKPERVRSVKKQFGERFLATKCETGTVCKANGRRGRNTRSVFSPMGHQNPSDYGLRDFSYCVKVNVRLKFVINQR